MSEIYKDDDAGVQNLATVIGFLLPILQIFFQFIPNLTSEIFLFRNYFLFVSIFAALLSFTLIMVLRSYAWFEIPFSSKSHKDYQNHNAKINPNIFSQEEISKYLKKQPLSVRPFYFTPNNIFIFLLPIFLISFVSFLLLGFINPEIVNSFYIIFQIISYLLLISSLALLLANYQIKESNRKDDTKRNRSMVKKAIQLSYENNAFEEYPRVSFLSQWQSMVQGLINLNFIFKVNDVYYLIVTDYNENKILVVDKYNTYEDLSAQLRKTGEERS